MTAGIDLRHMWSTVWSFASHVWSAKWEAQKAPNEHIGVLNLTHKLRMFGKTITPINLDVQANQVRILVFIFNIIHYISKSRIVSQY